MKQDVKDKSKELKNDAAGKINEGIDKYKE